MSRYLLSFKKAIKTYLRIFFYFILFFYSTLLVTLKEKKKKTYMICTAQVSNNRQVNTLITVHREVERDPSKKKSLHIVHTDKGITTEESFTE